jgi:hypothetical protein
LILSQIKPNAPVIVKGRTEHKLEFAQRLMSYPVKLAVVTAFLVWVLFPECLSAQETSEAEPMDFAELVEWAYGQDQELVNGLQYYNRHPRSLGHPYLLEGWVHQGSVNIRGKVYPGIWLKYDIHAQHVEVEYRTVGGADNQVILVSDRVRNFYIGTYYFERLELEEGIPRFYQVLGEGRMIWYIHWEKTLVPKSGDARFIEEYTSPKRNYLLKLDGRMYPFRGKKDFVGLFPKDMQKDMKRLIKNSQIQIRSAPTEQLELFIIAAGNLLNAGAP